MKRRISRSLVSMLVCLAMVMGICVVPASASAREVSDRARVWVNSTEIMVNNRDNGPGTFSRDLIVIAYDPDAKYTGTKVYGPAVEDGEIFKLGTYNIFTLNIPTTDSPMEFRIEFLDSDWKVEQSITVQYDVVEDTLTVLQPTGRTIIVDGVEIAFTHFDYYDDEYFYGEMYVDATKNPTYEPYNIVVEFHPNLDSTGSMPRPGPLASFSLNGRVGDVTHITFRITLYDHNYQNAIQIYTTYDVVRNDFIHPSI